MAINESLGKPDDMTDEEWESLGKPHDDVEYDENEQPITVVIEG